MKINLKSTIFLSAILALVLNLAQFASSFATGKDAFAPGWADSAAAATPLPSTGPPKLTIIAPAQTVDVGSAPAAVTASLTTVHSGSAPDVATRLSSAGLRPDFAGLYLAVQQQTGTPWQLLAAVHEVETGQSGTTTRSSGAGATGPMQFMPATFNHYAVDGNGDGVKDIHNIDDAMYTAGRYLAAGGAARGQYASALYNYNHSWSYVSRVTGISSRLGL